MKNHFSVFSRLLESYRTWVEEIFSNFSQIIQNKLLISLTLILGGLVEACPTIFQLNQQELADLPLQYNMDKIFHLI